MMLTLGVGTIDLKGAFDNLTLWKSATQNPSIACCRLPVELLQTIFSLLARLYASDTTKGHRPSPRPEWIEVTHVCRHWRSAALGLRKLWSSITPGLSISWAQAMIERSSPLPILIDLRISTSSTDGLHPLAASEILFAASRIGTLRLVGLRMDILRVLDRLRSPSPLESLSLSIYDSGPPVLLPGTLFGAKAPRLRRLTLSGDACIQAPLWLLAGITEFTTGADFALGDLLAALRAMPQLEILRVQHCRAMWESDYPTPTVTLPRLQLISFRDTTPRRFVLLSQCIDVPPTVRRHLFWRLWAVASWTRWTDMLRAMRAFIPRDSAPDAEDGDLRAVRVAGGVARGSFSIWTRSARGSYDERKDALFLFEIDWSGSPVDPQGGAETMLEHSSPFFHLAELCAQHLLARRVLDLTIEPELETETETETNFASGMGMGLDVERLVGGDGAAVVQHWESFVGPLRSVQVLRLHRGSSPVLQVLSANPHLLPDLRKLYVVQCDVRRVTIPVVPSDGVALWNLKRFATLRTGSLLVNHGPVVTTRDPLVNIGDELVKLVRGRAGLEVVLVGCGMDIGALDELRRHTQVSIGDESQPEMRLFGLWDIWK